MGITSGLVTSNLRQQLLPFVIDPSMSINKEDWYSVKANNNKSAPQMFSFRRYDISSQQNKRGLINLIPSDWGEFDKDVGLKQLLSYFLCKDLDRFDSDTGSSNLNTILDYIPGVQIREFSQDTNLETLFSILQYGLKGLDAGIDFATSTGEGDAKKQKLAYQASYVRTAVKDDGFWKGMMDTIKDNLGPSTVYDSDVDIHTLAIDLIHCLYYRMVGSVTTNIYTIPNSSNQYLNSTGSTGWPSGNPFGFGGTSNNSAFGKLLNLVGGNVKMVTEPVWNAQFGGDGTQINIELNLFNDTWEHALNNFLFVNTLVPQNMFLQYGLWQQPPSAYDIKIEGGMRYFMCKGNISCNNKGVVRSPSRLFLETLIGQHLNGKGKSKKEMKVGKISWNNMIKIPDVYEIKMQFTSMLPDSFNTYIMTFAMDNNIKTIAQPSFLKMGSDAVIKYVQTKVLNKSTTAANGYATVDKNQTLDGEDYTPNQLAIKKGSEKAESDFQQ